MRQRYERMFRDRDNAEMLSDDAARAADAAREAANAAARTAFHGSIATVFTKHLRQPSLLSGAEIRQRSSLIRMSGTVFRLHCFCLSVLPCNWHALAGVCWGTQCAGPTVHPDDIFDASRVYIDAEEKGLRETLETLVREESWKPMEDAAQTNVLRSASELFAVIKKSLQRCSRFVSRGEPMLRLMGAFQASPYSASLFKQR